MDMCVAIGSHILMNGITNGRHNQMKQLGIGNHILMNV